VRNPKEPNVGDREEAPQVPPPGDNILIRRFLSGDDPGAFQELVERHLPAIRRLLYTLFNGQREEMEDAEQEIILGLFQGLKEFRCRSSFRTYFYRLARNRGIDCLRRKRSRERTLLRMLSTWQSREPADPEQLAIRREEIDNLLDVFQTLPSKERQLILMKDVDGFSIEEMAEILRVPPGTVKSRLHRARDRLLRTVRRER
jgi:RNA polymerase sigma-70 factor (ECF subfamily)